ncbi:hypothetical protein AALO_G00033900 [Alosa alosa]|uniref:non-specific serine/threonine protein kinase n=1 Tax=Alosa alosa TaxID=278164 RepID=A0AAV6HCI8_9TELE|nr:hypothetical protein AALO_G00033900 [Alosa alosa]
MSTRTPLLPVNDYSASQQSHGVSKSSSNSSRNRKSMSSAVDDDLPQVGNYRLIKTIGKGNFAKVKLARHTLTGKEVAVKIIDKTQLNSSSLQKLFREVRIMKQLNHPNIGELRSPRRDTAVSGWPKLRVSSSFLLSGVEWSSGQIKQH